MPKEDFVPVTAAMVELIHVLRHSQKVYINESLLAESLNLEKISSWDVRCHELFFSRYAKEAALIGLKLNEQTYQALMRVELPEEVLTTLSEELPQKFAFDPWAAMGYGGIVRLPAA